ncbi:MAG: SAM-dependent methyltransferase, partial [Phycisphaeraceae bacterium]
MHDGPIAPVPDVANDQHYELPAQFFELVLGPHCKYSSGFWPKGVASLADSEQAALAETCAHAQLKNGQDILELGCGWGSVTLFMARSFPESRITAVSNSHSQRAFIEQRAKAMGLTNITVITADMNEFAIGQQFDRIVSVEMFEHMRNYRALLDRTRSWLRP